MAQILVFGDSIALGSWDKEGGWVTRLKKYFSQKRVASSDQNSYVFVYNLAVSGDTTQELLARFEHEVRARHADEDPKDTIFIFAIGINDAQWENDKKQTRVDQKTFRQNLKDLIELAKNYSPKIIFLGLTPVGEAKVDPIFWMPELSYKNKHIKKFSETIKLVCQEVEVDFIEVFKQWVKADYKKWLYDGVHPNAAGHKKIFGKVKDFLRAYYLI